MSDGMSDRRELVVTNVDVEELARSPAVSAFMARIAEEFFCPDSRELLSASLAEAVCNVFDLHLDDGFGVPPKLYELAADLAREWATRRR
jgi:hypothetical protein